MSHQLYICHSRYASDKRVAHAIIKSLGSEGFKFEWDDGKLLWETYRRQNFRTTDESAYFFDTVFPEYWLNVREQSIRSSDYLIVLLSPGLPKTQTAIRELLFFQYCKRTVTSEGELSNDPCYKIIPVLIRGNNSRSVPYLGDCAPIIDFRPPNFFANLSTGWTYHSAYRDSDFETLAEQIFLRTGYNRDELLRQQTHETAKGSVSSVQDIPAPSFHSLRETVKRLVEPLPSEHQLTMMPSQNQIRLPRISISLLLITFLAPVLYYLIKQVASPVNLFSMGTLTGMWLLGVWLNHHITSRFSVRIDSSFGYITIMAGFIYGAISFLVGLTLSPIFILPVAIAQIIMYYIAITITAPENQKSMALSLYASSIIIGNLGWSAILGLSILRMWDWANTPSTQGNIMVVVGVGVIVCITSTVILSKLYMYIINKI